MALGILIPGPETEPVLPALAGRFLTAGLPGKALSSLLLMLLSCCLIPRRLAVCLTWLHTSEPVMKQPAHSQRSVDNRQPQQLL